MWYNDVPVLVDRCYRVIAFALLSSVWASKISVTEFNTPMHFPTFYIAVGVLFTPKQDIASLQMRLRCSVWRSMGIFLPGRPIVLTKRDHRS